MPLLFAYGINKFSHDVAQLILLTPHYLKQDIIKHAVKRLKKNCCNNFKN